MINFALPHCGGIIKIMKNTVLNLFISNKNSRCFKKDQSGATAIEYGLIAAGIALVIMGALFNTSGSIGQKYDNLANTVNTSLSK